MAAASEPSGYEESAALRLRPHPIIFLRAGLWIAVAAGLAAFALATGDPTWALAAALFFAGGIAAAVEAGVARATTELAVADGRLQLASGLLRRRVSECFPRGVLGLEVRQGPLGRLLDCGWLRVRGLGDEGTWLAVPAPRQLSARIEALALGAPAGSALRPPRPAPAPRLAVVEAAGEATRRAADGDARGGLTPDAQRDRF